MTKWEYKSVAAVWKDGSGYQVASQKLDDTLTNLGIERWELISVVPSHYEGTGRIIPDSEGATYMHGHNTFTLGGEAGAGTIYLFFKRVMEDGTEHSG